MESNAAPATEEKPNEKKPSEQQGGELSKLDLLSCVYFPNFPIRDIENGIKYIVNQLAFADSASVSFSTIDCNRIYYAKFSNSHDAEAAISMISGLEIQDGRDKQPIQITACKFDKISENIKGRTIKLKISSPEEIPNFSEMIKKYVEKRGYSKQQDFYDDKAKTYVIDFSNKEDAAKCLLDITCTSFNRHFLTVEMTGDDGEQNDKLREEVFKRLGQNGIRMKTRQLAREHIMNRFSYQQVKALDPNDENSVPGYNRFFGLLLVIFQFEQLYSDLFQIHVSSFENIKNGIIIGTISPPYSEKANETIIAHKKIITNTFLKTSVMRLSGFCTEEGDKFNFAAVWADKGTY